MKENRKAGLEGESNGGTEGGMVSGREGRKECGDGCWRD